MVSIKNSVAELERCFDSRRLVVECYIEAIRNMSLYAVELDTERTKTHRQYLSALADDVFTERPKVFEESRGTLRGILRNYRDHGAEYLADLRAQIATTAETLEQVLHNLDEGDGNHEASIRASLAKLRETGRTAPANPLSQVMLSTAESLERSLQELRKQHGFTTSQLQMEIRSLQKRVEQLETAAAIDEMTRLYNRAEMEARIRALPESKFSFLLMKTSGFRRAKVQFTTEVTAELGGAFAKRLRGSLPPESVIGRWSEEEFIAILPQGKSETMVLSKWISDHMSGSYSCISAGKAVHPTLQLNVAVMDNSVPTPRLLERISEFFVPS